MSTINVTNLSGRNGSPNLPDGAVVTGVVTSTTFDGNLKSTGTPTLGLGVTINSSGLVVSGVATAGVGSFTTVYGDGSNLTGVGETVAPWHYNPDVNDTAVLVATGIGITFNKKVEAGSGTATLKIVNAGVAGTTIQSWGVSSCTFNVTEFTLGSLVSDLIINQTYQLDIPSGFLKDSGDTDFVGTAYTFTVEPAFNKLWTFGRNDYGQLGHGDRVNKNSPVQVPSTTGWKAGWGEGNPDDSYVSGAVKKDGTLYMWGRNSYGVMGISQPSSNPTSAYSSPVQVPGTTWSKFSVSEGVAFATKTDGTLWAWGGNGTGALAQNDTVNRSSPIQVGSDTTWSYVISTNAGGLATKTNGTMWAWGYNANGQLGLNNRTNYSSPVQLPGTNWTDKIGVNSNLGFAIKTDGTLWSWGANDNGALGHNQAGPVKLSSPTQIGSETTWALLSGKYRGGMATKTDGTLWAWGDNELGGLGIPALGEADRSSPVQIPGTTWPTSNSYHLSAQFNSARAIKTDGTLWAWGYNAYGNLGQGNDTNYSSPTQVGSLTDWDQVRAFGNLVTMAIQKDETP